MEPITTFTPAVCRKLHDEMTEALRPVLERYGLTVRAGGGSYSPSGWTAKFDVTAASADGAPTGKDADAFRANARFLGVGLEASDLGRTFKTPGGQAVRIVGLKGRSGRIIGERGGKLYLYEAHYVALALGKKPEDSLKGVTLTQVPPGTLLAPKKKGR